MKQHKTKEAKKAGFFSTAGSWVVEKFNSSLLKQGFAMFSKKSLLAVLLDALVIIIITSGFMAYLGEFQQKASYLQQLQQLTQSNSSEMMDSTGLAGIQQDLGSIQTAFFAALISSLLAYFLVKPFVWKLAADRFLKKERKAGWRFWAQWKYIVKFLAVTLTITIINTAAYLAIRAVINPEFVVPALLFVALPLHLFFMNNANIIIALNESYLGAFAKSYKLIKRIHHYIIPVVIMAVVFLMILLPLFTLLMQVPYAGNSVLAIILLFFFAWARQYLAVIVHKELNKI